MKFVKFFVLLILTLTFSSCDPSMLNPDSYGQKWENTYLWFNPENLETIYVSENGTLESATGIQNKTDYEITWIKTGDMYELSFTSNFERIDFAWFDGYKAESADEEIPFVIENNTYHLNSSKLVPPDEGLYRISLTRDLTK